MAPILRLACAALLILGLPALLCSQATYTAQLTGTVTDSSGGVVAGVKVILTDEATNIEATATTDDRGVYGFTGVRPGSYMLRVEAKHEPVRRWRPFLRATPPVRERLTSMVDTSKRQ